MLMSSARAARIEPEYLSDWPNARPNLFSIRSTTGLMVGHSSIFGCHLLHRSQNQRSGVRLAESRRDVSFFRLWASLFLNAALRALSRRNTASKSITRDLRSVIWILPPPRPPRFIRPRRWCSDFEISPNAAGGTRWLVFPGPLVAGSSYAGR